MQTYYGMAVNNDTKTMDFSNTRLNWFGRGSPGAHTMNRKISEKLQSYLINFKEYVLIMMVPFSPFKQFLSLPYDMLHRHAHTQSEEALVLIKMIPTY